MLDLKIIHENYPYDLLLKADESMDAISKYIDSCVVFEILLGYKTIGVMAVKMNTDDSVELKNIAILEEYQRSGFGKQAVLWLENYCKGLNIKTIYVGTGDASFGQQKFYNKLGFKEFGLKENFFLQNYPDAIFENAIQLRHMVMFHKQI